MLFCTHVSRSLKLRVFQLNQFCSDDEGFFGESRSCHPSMKELFFEFKHTISKTVKTICGIISEGFFPRPKSRKVAVLCKIQMDGKRLAQVGHAESEEIKPSKKVRTDPY